MNLGGLGLRALLLKDQLHIKPCVRCGLHYDEREPECPHCSGLSSEALKAMLEEKELEREGNAPMGRIFLLIGFVLAVLVLIGALKL